jgi:hypothetical protein
MRELVASLAPEERALLSDPDFITEDEADVIISKRRMDEPGEWISAEELFQEFGIPPRHKRTA